MRRGLLICGEEVCASLVDVHEVSQHRHDHGTTRGSFHTHTKSSLVLTYNFRDNNGTKAKWKSNKRKELNFRENVLNANQQNVQVVDSRSYRKTTVEFYARA